MHGCQCKGTNLTTQHSMVRSYDHTETSQSLFITLHDINLTVDTFLILEA